MWRCASYSFDTRMPIIMGILNLTPDSFSDGGSYETPADALQAARKMVEDGARIIDVGGESTRQGSAEVSIEEELRRTIDIVGALADEGICVSIDTRHPEVARAAVDAGASIINDVSGFRDSAMVEVAKNCDAGLVVMHMKGTPDHMQDNPSYDDVVDEVRTYLINRAHELEENGIAHDRICIDPGPGFGKTPQQTIELVRNFHEFVRTGYPVMAALSRKSFLGYAYGIENPKDRDKVSAAETLAACEMGASVVRVHNVEETARALKDLRPYVYIGLGSNVALVANEGEECAGKIAILNRAIAGLCALPDSQVIDVSSYYESEPAYYEDQDPFVNAVVLLRSGIPPKELLDYLHAIENSLGRVREIPNGPRTLDLDIIDYEMYVVDNPTLTLPHPRALERDFVVKPLMEINPAFVFANDVPLTDDQVKVGAAKKIEG